MQNELCVFNQEQEDDREEVCTHLTADREQTNACEDMANGWESNGHEDVVDGH